MFSTVSRPHHAPRDLVVFTTIRSVAADLTYKRVQKYKSKVQKYRSTHHFQLHPPSPVLLRPAIAVPNLRPMTMTAAEIRQSFLDFFREKEHSIVPSASLLPQSPGLLFTNAGMNQFVPYFLGTQKAP